MGSTERFSHYVADAPEAIKTSRAVILSTLPTKKLKTEDINQLRRELLRASLRRAAEQDQQLKIRARSAAQSDSDAALIALAEVAKASTYMQLPMIPQRGRGNASFWLWRAQITP